MTAAALWTAVKAAYSQAGLISLTNQGGRAASTINDTFGESAAQEVLDLWPAFTHEPYDAGDATHVAAARQGVIAVLWRRGGTSTQIAKVKWDEVFSSEGLLSRIRRTGARARLGPSSNSGVVSSSELASGMPVRGWSDTNSLPPNFLPNRTTAGQ